MSTEHPIIHAPHCRRTGETAADHVDRLGCISAARYAEEDAMRAAFIGPRIRLEWSNGQIGEGRYRRR